MTIDVTINPQTDPNAPRATNQTARLRTKLLAAASRRTADSGPAFSGCGHRHQWRVGAFRRSSDRLAVHSAAEREPLSAVETRWKGTYQRPPADGQQRNSRDGEHRAYPVEGMTDRGLADGHGFGSWAAFVLSLKHDPHSRS